MHNLLKWLGLVPQVKGLMNINDDVFGKGSRGDTPPPQWDQLLRQQGNTNIWMMLLSSLMNRPNEVTPFGSRIWSGGDPHEFLNFGGAPTGGAPGQGGGGGGGGGSSGSGIMPGYYDDTGNWVPPGPNNGNPAALNTGTVPPPPGSGGQPPPRPTVTTTLSPQMQRLLELDLNSREQLGNLLQGAGTRVQDALDEPIDFSGLPTASGSPETRNKVEQALMDRQMRFLRPRLEQERDSLETELANRGFSIGAEGYDEEKDKLYMRQDSALQDASDRAILAGGEELQREFGMNMDARRQGISEILAKRQIPLAELASLRGGSAPIMPNFQPYATVGTPGSPNFLQAGGLDQQGDLGWYGLESQRSNYLHNGIMDILRFIGGGAAGSDRRLKSNIIRLGTDQKLGIGIYSYVKNGQSEVGVMADEVLHVRPEAVGIRADGYMTVDYGRL